METFLTIQGEGFHTGTAAYFIRLGGCDVGCTWCDVKESWNADDHPHKPIDQLAQDAADSGAEVVVVTGGEPAMYNLEPLTSALRKKGLKTHIETSGAHPITGEWHWICFSPKKFKQPLTEVYQQANELKVVVFNKHDFEWATQHAELVSAECLLFLQPEWSKREKTMNWIVDFVTSNTQWRVSLQTHKYLDIP